MLYRNIVGQLISGTPPPKPQWPPLSGLVSRCLLIGSALVAPFIALFVIIAILKFFFP